MPKKILNLQNKIFNVAWNLFSKNGYENVDMKAIASGCDIAVGTLYNYYGNKKDLFLKVLEASWTSTFKRIEEINYKDKSQDEINHEIVKILYYDIKERRGLSKYLLDNSSISEDENNMFKDKVPDKLFLIIKDKGGYSDTNEFNFKSKKLTHIILCNIVLLSELYPLDDESNILFLNRIIEGNIV